MKPILSKAIMINVVQVIGFVILFIGPFSIPCHGQVVALWTDGNGNWSNGANWSSCAPAACPVVPNNSGGVTYDAVIPSGLPNGGVAVTFDLGGAVVNSLSLSGENTLQDNGHDSSAWPGAKMKHDVAAFSSRMMRVVNGNA